MTFSRAFPVVEWPCFRSKNWVPSTQYPVPSTQYPVPSTQYPVPSTQYPVPSTQYPVPSTQYPVPRQGADGGFQDGSSLRHYVMGRWDTSLRRRRTVRYFYCFGVSFFLTLRWVLRAPPVKWWGVKFASTQTAPRSFCTFPSEVKY